MPEVDLSNCDREPIQIIGHVQPHGALLVLDPVTWVVLQASESAEALFGIAALAFLGRSFAQALTPTDAERLRVSLATTPLQTNPDHLLEAMVGGRGPFHILGHVMEGCLVLEIERVETGPGPEHQLLPGWLLTRFKNAQNTQAYYDGIAQATKELTGFDRVMVYRFSKDGSGVVVAECAEPHLQPYLGLNYPASDIPAQARRLFALNPVRIYPDVDYAPSPLVPLENLRTGRPLDMTYCVLRGVSRMHTQYLHNMGVKASMALAITHGEELWGLIACHHYQTRLLPYATRAACAFLSHLVSLQIADKQLLDETAYRQAMGDRLQALAIRLLAAPDLRTALSEEPEGILGLMEVGGVVVATPDGRTLLGNTPEDSQVRDLVAWLTAHQPEPVWDVADLAKVYAPAGEFDACAVGMMSVQASPTAGVCVLFFLPEQVQTIDWAGNPEKPVEREEDGRLSPRGSFELWRTTVAGTSRPWLESERRIAAALRLVLSEALTTQANEVVRLDHEWGRRDEERAAEGDAFAFLAAHDPQEPLRAMRDLARILYVKRGGAIRQEDRGQLESIILLSKRLEDLLDWLVRYGRGSREELASGACDLSQTVEQAQAFLGAAFQETGGTVVVGDLPKVRADFDLTVEVFQNLFSNVLKYNRSGRRRSRSASSSARRARRKAGSSSRSATTGSASPNRITRRSSGSPREASGLASPSSGSRWRSRAGGSASCRRPARGRRSSSSSPPDPCLGPVQGGVRFSAKEGKGGEAASNRHNTKMPALDAEPPSRRLKDATAALHRRVEDGVDILRQTESVATAVGLLRRMEAFYRAFEPLIAAEPGFVARLPRLQADLDALAPGWSPLPAPEMPTLESPLGGLYVIEGAALGGQIIARHLRERLGFASGFFGGEGVGPRWRAFRARLDETPDYDAVERSAVATFLAFERAVVREVGVA